MSTEKNVNSPSGATAPRFTADPDPPLARREGVEQRLHGDRRVDHYAWLRHKGAPEVAAYLEAENAYTDAATLSSQALEERLYREMLDRIQQTDLSVPYRLRGYLYYLRTEQGKQYPIHFRSPEGSPPASGSSEELLLDLNQLAEGHAFFSLEAFEISDDNRYLAYSTDTTGFRQYTLFVRDLLTRTLLVERIERVTSAVWAGESRTLFYTVEDEVTKRSHRLFRHVLGSGGPDNLLYEEFDERFRIGVEKTRSGAFLLLTSASHTTSEVRFLRADDPQGSFALVAPRQDNQEYYLDHHPELPGFPTADRFLIRTNSSGRTFQLASAPSASPVRDSWQTLIPIRPEVMLADLAVFETHLVLFERENGLPYLRIVDLGRPAGSWLESSSRIRFSEPAYDASLGENPEFSTSQVRYHYQSFITPRSVYDCDLRTGQSTLRKQQPVLGGHDPADYVSERLHSVAKDGTPIPLSVVFHKQTPRDGTAPLLLYGYGSYGIPVPVNFSSNRLSLLRRGVIYVVAHIRGGGELGKPWHDAGRLKRKMNTFTDFIASAEELIKLRYTSQEKLVIEGGSAGGLLMGAVTNLRPDLFRIVVSHVPFVDVLNTMLDTSLPLTVGEYEEWGNPNLPEDYFLMKSYCPYTNIGRKSYPAMLVKTGLNDSQVMYWEPAKYVAKLRALKTDANLLLFKTNMGAGHGGASGRYDYLREIAFDYAFVLTQLGIRE